MSIEVMILFIIVAAGLAAYYYVEARTQKTLYDDIQKIIKTYKTEIEALNIEVSYWKSKYTEANTKKKSVRKNKTK